VAMDGVYAWKKIGEPKGLQPQELVDLLDSMIFHAKKAADKARGVKRSFNEIRKELTKVMSQHPLHIYKG
jgi:hypothetical protein